MLALLFAANGNFPIFTLNPCARACASVSPDAADAGLGVGAAGNAIAVDRLGRLAGHVRHRDHALRRGDVRQLRRSRHHIADRIDARLAGALIFVHLDEAAIQLDLRVSKPDVIRDRLAAHRDQQRFRFDVLALAVGERDAHAHAVLGLRDVFRLRAGLARECRSS